MGRFMKEPWSPEFAAAVRALEELQRVTGPDTARRAAAEALAPRMREDFLRQRGVAPAGGLAQAKRLLGRRAEGIGERLGFDHQEVFRRPRPQGLRRVGPGVDLLIGQPYGVSWERLQELVDRCRELGLEARISGDSWHFPGWTVLIEIRRAVAP